MEIVLSIEKSDKIVEELLNKQLIFERLKRLEENREIVLKRLNKHNDHTLLEDQQFISIVETTKFENSHILKDVEIM